MSASGRIITSFNRSVLGNYGRIPVAFVRGRGAYIWDADGRKYLDFFPGWGVGLAGHCPPAVVRAIKRQSDRLIFIANSYYHPLQGELASRLVRLAGFPARVFFCNSGAEANEAAFKLARRWAQVVRGQKRYEIVTVKDSFHGRTLAALTATGQPKYQVGFAPLPGGFRHIPLNDIRAAKKAIGRRTAAVLIETILGEGGIQVPSPAFLRALRSLTRKQGALLIFDEVQAGGGRTGSFFAFRQAGVVPDAVTLAKPLAGGLPMGALLLNARLASALPPGTHASSFGGGPLVCAAALAALKEASSPRTLARVTALGGLIRKGLEGIARRHPHLVKEVRGRGLMLGMELNRPGAGMVARCREMGLLLNCTHDTVIRMLPPLVITRREIAAALGIIERALSAETAPAASRPRV
jgi:predicted acetylornithine/succinylornithine family transaminase